MKEYKITYNDYVSGTRRYVAYIKADTEDEAIEFFNQGDFDDFDILDEDMCIDDVEILYMEESELNDSIDS